jgi:hypothetical protein
MKRSKTPPVRVIKSVPLSVDQFQRYTRAAKVANEKLVPFIRAACEARSAQLLRDGADGHTSRQAA